tara:strand:+ start:8045 stop:8671 length:627 start_codon:yes stop_codon:yes gene_type:complete
MAFQILLKAFLSGSASPYATYQAGNVQSFDYAVQAPASTFGLPEFFIEGAIITKAEGNTGKVVFSWVIKEETTTPFSVKHTWNNILTEIGAGDFYPGSKAWDGNNSSNSGNNYKSRRILTVSDNTVYETFDTTTADGQMIALSEYFEKKGLTSTDRHRFQLKDATAGKYIFDLEGQITRLSFQKSGTDPVTWNASIEFQIGDVIDSSE